MQKYFPNEMIGNRYGKIIVESFEKVAGKTFLNCVCDCGNKISREPYMIAKGQVKSCGCSRSIALKRYNASGKHSRGRLKDGRSQHPLYGTWLHMISRCENPNYNYYDRYGGRGIKVCEEWHDFWIFVKWSDSIGGKPKGYTLDRINNDGNYEPSNCRWADHNTQSRNKSSNIILEYNGISMTLSDWANKLSINQRTLNNRINRGWSIERALTEKVSSNNHLSRNKKLFCYDKNNNLVKVYNSLSDIPNDYSKRVVSDCCCCRKKTYKGYIWKYEDE